MRKKGYIIFTLLSLFLLVGCGGTESKYNEAIDLAIEFNHDLMDEKDYDDWKFERDESYLMVWEDEYNYYVYLRKNVTDDVYGEGIHGDGYKVGKKNGTVSSSPSDRKTIVNFYRDNVKPLFEEKNIELFKDKMDMR